MSESTLPPAAEAMVAPLPWPPPGLGRIQGDLWIVALAVADRDRDNGFLRCRGGCAQVLSVLPDM